MPQLLDNFRKHISFIHNTHNPALDHLSDEDHQFSKELMDQECANLLTNAST